MLKKILSMFLPAALALASVACLVEGGDTSSGGGGDGGSGGAVTCERPTAIDGVAPVLAAYIACVEAADGPEIVEPLIGPAREASADPEVEAARAGHAIDNLVRGHLAPFVAAAGVPASDWLDTLPAGELSPAEAYAAALSAQRLATWLRAALPLDEAPWVTAYEAIAAQRHAAIHAVVGRPNEWYASPVVHQATWDLALVAGFSAGQEAWDAAPKDTPAEIEAAVGAAVQALLGENAGTFAGVRANAVAEIQVLTAME
ncbi:hypothetical protein [Sorangium sp. So ce233]|uniref:hypothetical protein n=1 Tax=Sorangium sp. So ce233 TaxID=3133290 RepID=UPI003F5EFC2D